MMDARKRAHTGRVRPLAGFDGVGAMSKCRIDASKPLEWEGGRGQIATIDGPFHFFFAQIARLRDNLFDQHLHWMRCQMVVVH